MFAAPAEGTLKDFMEFGDTGCADHEQSPPHQRTHAAEHYAKLIDRNGRYRRFTHANSLSKRKPTVLNLMTPPGISRSPFMAIDRSYWKPLSNDPLLPAQPIAPPTGAASA